METSCPAEFQLLWVEDCCTELASSLYLGLATNLSILSHVPILMQQPYVFLCSFTDNAGLCGIPGLPTCGPHLSAGAKVGVGLAVCLAFLLLVGCSIVWWKRRQNILRAQRLTGKKLP